MVSASSLTRPSRLILVSMAARRPLIPDFLKGFCLRFCSPNARISVIARLCVLTTHYPAFLDQRTVCRSGSVHKKIYLPRLPKMRVVAGQSVSARLTHSESPSLRRPFIA